MSKLAKSALSMAATIVGLLFFTGYVLQAVRGDAAPKMTDTEQPQAQACAIEAAHALPLKMAAQPQSGDASCRQWTEDFVRAGLLGNCLSREKLPGWYTAFQDSCMYLQKIRSYCPPTDWPSDARKPSVRDACRLS